MKKDKSPITQKQKQSLKRLYMLTAVSGMICALLAVSAFSFFFMPHDRDMYVLTLPKLVGLDERLIGEFDGINIRREWVYSNEVEHGRVISQTPYGGARRKIHSGERLELTVFVSLGEKSEDIPELSGVEEMSAAAALRSLGARVRSVPIYSDTEDGCGDGNVLYTSPSCGERIKEGDTVTMFVRRVRVKGPITVPDLCGLELAEAYRRALSLGLNISDRDIVFIDNIVTSQSLPEGARVRHGSYISFKTEDTSDKNEREWPPR